MALIIEDIGKLSPGDMTACVKMIADYDYYVTVFGDLAGLEDSDVNPKFLVKQKLEKGGRITPIFMACGTEDFLLENNRDFRDFLVEHQADVTYYESPGTHEWKFWNEYLETAVLWALAGKEGMKEV